MKTRPKILNIVLLLLFAVLGTIPLYVWWWWGTDGIQLFSRKWATDPNSSLLSQLGQTGDIFGGINALFSAYALAAVATAAFLQWRSWSLFSHQRVQESFEPLFFHLLQLSARLKPDLLKVTDEDKPLRYAQGVAWLRDQVFPLVPQISKVKYSEENATLIKQPYLSLYWRNEQTLGPYMRSLFHTFRRIKTSSLPLKKKLEYVAIARSTLSTDDLFMLLLNASTGLGQAFKPLIEEYGLLKHIPRAPAGESETKEQKLAIGLFAETATLSTRRRFEFWKENKDVAKRIDVDFE